MRFFVIGRDASMPSSPNTAVLREDRWDDWGKYRTQFYLSVFDQEGTRHDVGEIKIGQRGLLPAESVSPGARAPSVPQHFDQLPQGFFSLGQGENYYETLNTLAESIKHSVLNGLMDCAFDLGLFESMLSEEVMTESLLRYVAVELVRTRLHRLAHGDARLTEFHFRYAFAGNPVVGSPASMDFRSLPEASPPTNVHVLIGRNGVGKSHCMRNLAKALLGGPVEDVGRIEMQQADPFEPPTAFAGLVSVSFSAFDEIVPSLVSPQGLRHTVVGIRRVPESQAAEPGQSPVQLWTDNELADDFVRSLKACGSGVRAKRWLEAIKILENDPLFEEAAVGDLLDFIEQNDESAVRSFFRSLSSGHAIVLLTMTKLVELVDERTLVLLDEPEGHLHPPLLSAFIRSLTELLSKRNGLAIVATHSPVVLQEVPKTCVWKLRRVGRSAVVERPQVETFGENVGVLTREVFGLEVTTSGFHKLINERVEMGDSYAQILSHFQGQLGAEGRSIAMALVALRDQTGQA